jgi:TonB family protein
VIGSDEQLHRRSARSTLDPTYAKPPPWFVGGGKGVMIAVLVLCAALFVARGFTMWWMVEEWWAWWHARVPITQAAPDSAPPAPPFSPPAMSAAVPPRVRGNPGAAFSADLYPADAIRAGEQGRVMARLMIDATGKPYNCIIGTSSGSRSLDRTTCTTALAKLRFYPARDRRGAAITSSYALPVRWVLPD